LRYTIKPKDEDKITTLFNGAAVVSATLLNNYLNEQDYAFNYGALTASYIYPLHLSKSPVRNLGTSISLGLFISYAIDCAFKNYKPEYVLSATLGGSIYAKIYQYTDKNIHLQLLPIIAVISFQYFPDLIKHILPIQEVEQSYRTLIKFFEKDALDTKLADLYSITFNTQLAISYLAITHFSTLKQLEYLFKIAKSTPQDKPNMRGVIRDFIIASISFRVFKIIEGTICNDHIKEFEGWLQTEFKSKYAFNKSNFAQISSSNSTISSYAGDLRNIASINGQMAGKISLLPRLALAPTSICASKEFLFLVSTLLALDFTKSSTISSINKNIVEIEEQLRFIYHQYSRIEQHDAQNHQILAHQKLFDFTKERYAKKAEEIQKKNTELTRLEYIKSSINAIYWEDILQSLPILFLGNTNEDATQIILHSKSAQDVIELLLTRLKDKSYYARVKKSYSRLNVLNESIETQPPKKLLNSNNDHILKITNLSFDRVRNNITQTSVNISDLTVEKGKIYALNGKNGSGKSSLFSILTNTIDDSFRITHNNYTITSTSPENIVLISQSLYCPFYIKPIDWINGFGNFNYTEGKIIEAMKEVIFYPEDTQETAYKLFLNSEHANLYQSLSRGQTTKMELLKEIFLPEVCPKLLLIDESLNSLDSTSKSVIYSKIKHYCENSIVIIAHHSEVDASCVPSYNLFDKVIDLKSGAIELTGVCQVDTPIS